MSINMNPKKTILIIGGDTGGHLYPAIAVAEYLRGSFEPVFFIGSRAVVRDIADRKGLRYFVIEGCAFPKMNVFKYPGFITRNFAGFKKAWKGISEIKPAAVFSTGGYMSFGPAMAAFLRGIWLVLHEQNIKPGLANILIGKFSDRVAVSFGRSEVYFNKKKVVLTGNPVRREILSFKKTSSVSELRILIIGGSQGAAFFNRLMSESVLMMNAFSGKISVAHITGANEFENVKKSYIPAKFKYELYPYCYDIGDLYSRSDLLISRSGAGSIFELIALKKPAILIPFPYAAGNHQYYNAKYLADNGCVLLRDQKDYAPDKLIVDIKNISSGINILENMSSCYDRLPESKLDALGKISELLKR